MYGNKESQLLGEVGAAARLRLEARPLMSPAADRELELVRKAQEGDDHAFARLVEPCVDPAYRLAFRLLRSAHDAEDAVQDALYKAWRALSHFRGEATFSTWLYRIVWRTCADRARRPQPVPAEVEGAASPGGTDPQAQLEEAEERRAVEAALRRLPVPYQAAVALFYLEDLPLKQVAEILGIPVGTVKTHLHRARRELRAALSERLDAGGVEILPEPEGGRR